ncbi:MAG: TolC family protein [Marinobacterium sp.]|nr:TolC family protein [Marinobacterium sp.]
MALIYQTFGVLVLCGVLGACTHISGGLPDQGMAERSQQQLAAVPGWQQQLHGQPVSQLSDLIDSPALAQRIARGLAGNPGLQQTALAVEIARQARASRAGALLPQLSAGLNYSDSDNGYGQFKSALDVSWALDMSGRLGDGVAAQQARVASAVSAERYSRDLLAVSIMDIWLQQVQQARLIAIEQQRLQLLEQNELTIVERYRKGLDVLTGLETARSNSASARATLAQYRENARTLQRAMALLLGEPASQLAERSGTVVGTEYPAVVMPLAALPAQDLSRRPDLQQAWLDIRVADLNRDIAYKALLPSFSLQLALSDTGSGLRQSLLTSPAWSLLGQLSAPLFQGGTLRAEAESARLTAQQRYWAYRETLLKAVKEVEDALGQERALSAQQQHVETALASAERSYNNYLKKYREGLVPFLDLLTVQTRTFDLQVQQSQVIYQRLSNRITLGLALGLGVNSSVDPQPLAGNVLPVQTSPVKTSSVRISQANIS